MILQALVERYRDSGGEKLGWKQRAADFALNLDRDGNIMAVIPLEQSVDGKKTRRMLSLPDTPTRTVAICPFFLCDKAEYIFGVPVTKKIEADIEKATSETAKTDLTAQKEKLIKAASSKRKESARFHRSILENVHSGVAEAIKNYFALEHELPEELTEMRNDCVFMVDGKYAYEDAGICEAWEKHYAESADEDPVRDLVTGEIDTLKRLQGEVNLRGVSMGKKPLVSVNAESFASYGKSASDPAADIGQYSSFAYVTALNELLANDSHHRFLAGDTLVYWAEEGGEEEAEVFSWTMEPKESDAKQLDSLVKAFVSGRAIVPENCRPERTFYILCLSPNAGRISIRYFYRNTFEKVIGNVLKHYQNMEVYESPKKNPEKFPNIPPWIILSETTVKGKAQDAAPLLGGQLLKAITSGERYPMTLYNALLSRIMAGGDVNRSKAAVIKAVLIRNFNEREVATVALNPDSDNKPYVLGRLFATLEQLQNSASGGGLNTTIKERYFASACANPASVFPTLLKLSVHHTAKLEGGIKVFYEKLKTELLGKLDVTEPFPGTLGLDDQGKFILGYYHQMQVFYTKRVKEDTPNE